MDIRKILDGEIKLENNIVTLKPLSYRDVSGLQKLALESPETFEFFPDPILTSMDLITFISKALKEQLSGTAYPFTIFDSKGEVAGTTRYGNISLRDSRLEIGWTWIGKHYRGTDLNKSCKFELLRFAFEELEMKRVEFKTDALNLRSRAAMKKIGVTEEGTLRSHTWMSGSKRYRDTVYYSILTDEWTKIKKTIFSEFK